MAGDTYIFIDGGHLRKYHTEAVEKWFGPPAPDLDLDSLRRSLSAQKCFYYDCIDDIKRPTESQDQFNLRLKKQEEMFSHFRRTVNTHVRLGALTGQGKKIRQKQVDILLAVDAMSHAARGNVRTVILLAGDQDFTPLVEALVNMGLFVHLYGDPKHTSTILADAADVFTPIQFTNYHHWCGKSISSRKRLPTKHISAPHTETVTKKLCTIAGMSATFYFHQQHYCFAIDAPEAKINNPTSVMIVEHPSKEQLELFCELEFGEVQWKSE